ncbi:Adenylate and Guanylate cyclase catalytic domain containing protein [Tritrichomonas foetus]|uniref:Adenylate and Guanylate cyclase catalytic domain containing protein n=1 Tax=Tritrichomonas foetus TaxID=1144522 RepID=A0A1J4K8C0_9EUKA|nr:Adenylate and Guanylate cyclase catalytic domain containing protein [Tritrichomonas foetus]|eukprot:OHT05910.1 Adenylate and Guanylate cyclase catalytic domain containing protein [Tritrichomonas foetus]
MSQAGTSQNGSNAMGTLSSQAAHRRKYHGLLKRSAFKNLRDNLFRFIDYINTRSPTHRGLINFMKVLSFIQIFLVSTLPSDNKFWVSNTIIGKIVNVISVIAFIFPTHVDQDTHLIVALVVEICFLVLAGTFVVVFMYFLKMSKCPSFFVNLINVTLCSLLIYLMTLFSSYFGRALYGIIYSEGSLPLNIVSLIISFVSIIPTALGQLYFVTPMLMLRPQAFHILFSKTMLTYIICSIFYSSLTTLGSLIDGIVGNILCLVSIVFPIPILYTYFCRPYSIGNHSLILESCGVYISILINPIFIVALELAGQVCGDYTLIVLAAIFCISTIGSRMYFHVFFTKSQQLIDQIENDIEYFEALPYSKALSIARVAFEDGFPIAHDWSLFNKLIEKYPTDLNIALTYARYAAIYPDETPTLHIAGRHLINLKHGSLETKHCIFQIHSILQQRDSSMSPSIKKSLNKTKAKIEKARGQIRYLWECIMRGNSDEIEGLSTHLKSLEEEIVRDYSQLCLVYPNNPYVAHAYSSFAREIMNNETLALEMNAIYLLLRQGKRTREERCYFFAQRLLPALPTEEQHSALSRGEKKSGRERIHDHSIVDPSVQASSADTFDPNQQAINEEKLQKRYVESMVESVRLPSMRYGPVFIIAFLVLVMPICIIPISISVVGDIDSVRSAMKVVMYSSKLRLSLSEMILLGYQTTFHNTNVTRMISLKERWMRTYGDSRPLPANWTTDSEALLQSIQDNRYLVKMVNSLAHQLAKSGYFEQALDVLYTPIVEFSSYSSHNTFTTGNFSLEYIITYLIGVAVNCADTPDPITFLDHFEFWTMVKNIKEMLPHFETFANYVVFGIIELTENSKKNVLVNVLSAIVIPYVVIMAFLIFLIIRLEIEKSMIFDVFKALPKSALSAIVTNLNSQNRNNDEENQEHIVASAQEENALRVLSTSVDSNSGRIGRLWPIFLLMIIFTIASVVSIIVLIFFAIDIADKFDLINPLFGAVPYVQSQFCAISLGILRLSAAAEFTPENCDPTCPLPLNAKANYTLVNNDLEDLLSHIVDAINMVRIGSETLNSSGLAIGGESIINLLTQNMCEPHDDVDYIIDVIDCLSYESGISVIWQKIRQMHQQSILEESQLAFDLESHNVIFSWLLGVAKHDYVDKSLDELDALATKYRNETVNDVIVIAIAVCVCVIVLCGITLVPQFVRLADVARWSLRLLLFCHPNIILQAKSIVKILSNDFSKKEENKDQSGANFYETVVSHLLDGVVFLNNELTIMAANTAVGTIIGVDPETIIDKKLNDILIPAKDSSSLKAFFAALQGALKAQRSPSIELEVEVMRGDESVSLLLSITAVSSSGNVQIKAVNAEGLSVLALVMKDITSTIASNKLLVEEGIKSEKLLLMILPPIIVNKLQSGEKNISFAVKSASIMFVDIVSFTPWCGSNTAAYVMKTLNRLFAEFDRILKKYDRMTKIKCIGDCYMCAGGIFDEINQPAEHAKQAICFGVDIIAALKLLNIELNEKLRIRVGVNTGGPIVAGVLGIEKPTFDILGPDICLAAMMEHHGVPMHVHIPQHCYELVFGSMFRIKERGDVEVKGKMYHTYIVSGYDQLE